METLRNKLSLNPATTIGPVVEGLTPIYLVRWRNGKRCVCSIRHQYEAVKILHVGLRKLVTGSNPVPTTKNKCYGKISKYKNIKANYITNYSCVSYHLYYCGVCI